MRYLTDRKRATGKGSARSGTHHHWYMSASAFGLAFMVPTFLYIFGRALGQDREGVQAAFAHPFAAILTGLVIFVGMRHFAKGATTMIEDYARGMTRRMLVIFVHSLGYAITATGLFALAKIAL